MPAAPIVGARFRPPAPLVLSQLGMDEPLLLLREPGNVHDENAIQVHLPQGWEERNEELFAEAVSVANENAWPIPQEGETFMLGYIAREFAASWAPAFDEQGIPSARLGFAATGQPIAIIEEDGE